MRRPALLRLVTWVILLGMVGFAACGGDGEEGDTPNGARDFVYPDPEWTVEAPEAHDLDSILLEEAADLAGENASNCFVVTRDGVIVGEWYWNDWGPTTEQNVFSVTKSFTNALVGIAQERGELQNGGRLWVVPVDSVVEVIEEKEAQTRNMRSALTAAMISNGS